MGNNFFIKETETVKDALKKLDKTAEKVLIVVNDRNKLLGAITDGDIRRYILKGGGLEGTIKNVYNSHPIYITKNAYSYEFTKKIFLENKIDLIPIVDEHMVVINFITWNKFFSEDHFEPKGTIEAPVVIMAGGKGTRLDPFTKILPKPLIPVGDKTIIEHIIDEFRDFGVQQYYLTLNYKADLIESYLNGIEKPYSINYIREDDFYGTAGSLKLLKDVLNDIFILSNCDVIVKANYSEVINIHKEQEADLTILSSIKHYKIPYGIVDFTKGGKVTNIVEKPEYTFTINTGVYVLDNHILQFIPEKKRFDMTDLIKSLIENGGKIITYPVNENDYLDIGEWEEYKRTVGRLHA